MALTPTDIPKKVKPLAEELIDNTYARENLQEGVEKLHDAYGRARKRRVKPSRDRKLRKQVESAIKAIDEGTAALASGRRKPSHKGRNAVLGLLVVTAAGTAVALAVSENLRGKVFGSAKALGDEIAGSDPETGAPPDPSGEFAVWFAMRPKLRTRPLDPQVNSERTVLTVVARPRPLAPVSSKSGL